MDKALQQQKTRDRVERYRKRQKTLQSVTNDGIDVTHIVTPEHPIMKYLIPGEDRKKMESIVESLGKHKQLHNVYLGCGRSSLPMDIVGEMLEVTR